MFFEKYSFKVLLFVFVLEIVFPVFVNGTPLKQELSSKVSLDFSEADIRDVVRAVSSAYHIPIIVDQIVNAKVTVHLENVEVWDALHAICGANGLSFRRENGVFRIQKETTGNKDFFALRNGKIDLNVNGKELKDFLQEFSKNTGLSVVFPAEIKGNVYANIQGVSPKAALSTILSANKYSLLERDSLFFVSQGAIISKENELEILRTGNRFCLKADGVSIGTIVRELAKKASKNIVLYAEAEENITLSLDSVTLNTALETIFNGSRFSYILSESGEIFVGEKEKQANFRKTKLFPLRYLPALKAVELLEKSFGDKGGKYFEIKEQNAVLLIGNESDITLQENFLTTLDLPIPQILLECLIVEFKKGNAFEIGFHSGNSRKIGEADLGFRGYFSFPGKDMRLFDGYGKIGVLPDQFILELASLEEKNLAEVLARPSISTMNGTKAGIFVTNTSYYQVNQVSPDGYPIVDYRSFNDGISLEITPTVTQTGEITINVLPEIKTSSRSSGDGPRDISTRNLQTTISLKDGETLCLGGLLRKTTSEVSSAVPFLGSIPLIGKFFSYVSKEEETSELVVFITPKVLKKEP